MSTKDYGGYTSSYGDGKVMKFDYPNKQNNVRKQDNNYNNLRNGMDAITQAFLDEVDAKYPKQDPRGDALQVNDPNNREEYMDAVDKKYPGVDFNKVADELEAEGYEEGAAYYRKLGSIKDITNAKNVNFSEIADKLEADGYEEGARFFRKLADMKQKAEDSGETARAFLTDYQKLSSTGMPTSKVLQTLSQKYDGVVNRETLIEKLQVSGFPKEYAEQAIPEDFDEQLQMARESGVAEVNRQYQSYKDPNGNPLQVNIDEVTGS